VLVFSNKFGAARIGAQNFRILRWSDCRALDQTRPGPIVNEPVGQHVVNLVQLSAYIDSEASPNSSNISWVAYDPPRAGASPARYRVSSVRPCPFSQNNDQLGLTITPVRISSAGSRSTGLTPVLLFLKQSGFAMARSPDGSRTRS